MRGIANIEDLVPAIDELAVLIGFGSFMGVIGRVFDVSIVVILMNRSDDARCVDHRYAAGPSLINHPVVPPRAADGEWRSLPMAPCVNKK